MTSTQQMRVNTSSATPSAPLTITIGVLALQGAFVEHVALLRQAAQSLRLHRRRGEELTKQIQRTLKLNPSPQEPPNTSNPVATSPSDSSSQWQQPQGARLSNAGSFNDGDSHDAAVAASSGVNEPTTSDRDPGVRQTDSALPAPAPTSAPEAEDANARSAADRDPDVTFEVLEVRTPGELSRCAALILPGGESTSISLIAERTGLLEPLRDFVKIQRRPVWGTCAGLILLAEEANRSKTTGQELIGGLDVRVQRNYFGRQVESFEADLSLSFLGEGERFHSVFIRAPVVERVLSSSHDAAMEDVGAGAEDSVTAPPRQPTHAEVQILARLPGRARTLRDKTTTAEDLGEDGDIVAVRQGNVFGTAFHPELTGDGRIHGWWLQEVVRAVLGHGG